MCRASQQNEFQFDSFDRIVVTARVDGKAHAFVMDNQLRYGDVESDIRTPWALFEEGPIAA